MKAHVTFLGSGTSHGVPMIGCTCAVCRSSDPRDARTRPSIYVDVEDGPPILVDTSTDLRQQALAHGVTRVDAILFTHSHADHMMGLDDLRRFSLMQKGPIPCYADARTCDDLRRSFFYVFDPADRQGRRHSADRAQHHRPARSTSARVGMQPVPLVARLAGRSSASASATSPISPTATACRTNRGRCSRGSTCWCSMRCAIGRIPRTSRWLKRSTSSRGSSRGRPIFTHICHDLPHAATNAALPAVRGAGL